MRTRILFAVLLLTAACGGAADPGVGGSSSGSGSSSGGSSSGGSSSGGSSGGSSSGGHDCTGPAPDDCYAGCNGQVTSAQCIDGTWICPPEPEIACPVDAGGPGPDAGAQDAGLAGDGGIVCGSNVCNAATDYCDIRGGGAWLPDAGSNMSYSCLPLPAMPCDAGTGCACVPNRCDCTDDGGYITNECLYP
jgi:hypothetical protein